MEIEPLSRSVRVIVLLHGMSRKVLLINVSLITIPPRTILISLLNVLSTAVSTKYPPSHFPLPLLPLASHPATYNVTLKSLILVLPVFIVYILPQ